MIPSFLFAMLWLTNGGGRDVKKIKIIMIIIIDKAIKVCYYITTENERQDKPPNRR